MATNIQIPALARVGFPEAKLPQLREIGIGVAELRAYLSRGAAALGDLLDALVDHREDSKPSFETWILCFSLCPCFGAPGLEYLLERGTKDHHTFWDLSAASLGAEMYIDSVLRGGADSRARQECAAIEHVLRGPRMQRLLQSLDEISTISERPGMYLASGDWVPYSDDRMEHLAGVSDALPEHNYYPIRALRLRSKLAKL